MLEHRDDLARFHEADIAFHKAILLATHNVVIQQLSDAISALQRAIFDYTLFAEEQHMALTLKEHCDLFEAIRRQNPEAAERHSHTMVQRTAVRAQQSAAAPEEAASCQLDGAFVAGRFHVSPSHRFTAARGTRKHRSTRENRNHRFLRLVQWPV